MVLEQCTPEEQKVDSAAIERMFDYWDEMNTHVHSCAIMRGGKLISLRTWEPYKADSLHMLNSMSKTFTSIGVMYAIQEGLFDEEDYVISFFPDVCSDVKICDNMKKVKIKHLLTMTTGHYPDNADFIISDPNPVKAFLSSEISLEPGTKFVYNTGATYMLSLIIGKVTGKSLADYLTPRLFEPLNIKKLFWESDSDGNSYGGFGLNIDILSAVKTGQFLLDRGCVDGKYLLSPELIDKATSAIVPTVNMEGQAWLDELRKCKEWQPSDWDCGYGWQIWRCVYNGAYRADGAFGQYCVVVPEHDLVVAVFSGSECSQYLLKGIWDCLIPGIECCNSVIGDSAICKKRKSEFTFGLSVPEDQDTESLFGEAYSVPDNTLGIKVIRLVSYGLTVFELNNGSYEIKSGYNEWIYNDLGFDVPKCSFPFVLRPYSHLNAAYAFYGSEYKIRLLCDGYAYYHEMKMMKNGDDMLFVCRQYPGGDSFEVKCTKIKGKDC